MEYEKHSCDVCGYVDGDKTEKDAFFCPDCKAWICEGCKDKKIRRFLAMCIRWMCEDVKI